jgi:hypothetical protein
MKKPQEGVVYVSSSGTYFDKSTIDADDLKEVLGNNYVQEQLRKVKTKVFTGMYALTVKDPMGETVEDISKVMLQMCETPDVRMLARMKQSLDDIVSWGCFLCNPVWDQDGSRFYLSKVRRLPPDSFALPAPGRRIYNSILQGITLNENEIEFWQVGEEGKAVQLRNVSMMKDQSTNGLAGESWFVPLVPIVKMLNFCWQAQMQKVNRVAAPVFFIRITKPTGDDEQFAQKILNRWGKDSAFQLRPNMEVVELNLTDNEAALNTISKLEGRIKQFFSAASSIQKEGSTLGGNAAAEKEMDDEAVEALRVVLEDEWEAFLQTYLDVNLYVGYTVELRISAKKQKPGLLEAKQAEVGFATRAMSINERREKLGLEPLDDDAIAKLIEEHQRLDPAGVSPGADNPFALPMNQVKERAGVLGVLTNLDPVDPERYMSDEEQRKFLGLKGKQHG